MPLAAGTLGGVQRALQLRQPCLTPVRRAQVAIHPGLDAIPRAQASSFDFDLERRLLAKEPHSFSHAAALPSAVCLFQYLLPFQYARPP